MQSPGNKNFQQRLGITKNVKVTQSKYKYNKLKNSERVNE